MQGPESDPRMEKGISGTDGDLKKTCPLFDCVVLTLMYWL